MKVIKCKAQVPLTTFKGLLFTVWEFVERGYAEKVKDVKILSVFPWRGVINFTDSDVQLHVRTNDFINHIIVVRSNKQDTPFTCISHAIQYLTGLKVL